LVTNIKITTTDEELINEKIKEIEDHKAMINEFAKSKFKILLP
jgi:hypothetical protein